MSATGGQRASKVAAFRLRTAAASDIPAMHAIRLGVRENRLADATLVREASYRRYVDAGAAWVAVSGEDVIGFAAAEESEGRVWALFVDERWEGGGVGSALHRHMLDWAGARGIDRLWLTTAEGSRAEAFYRARGWVEAAAAPKGEIRFERPIER